MEARRRKLQTYIRGVVNHASQNDAVGADVTRATLTAQFPFFGFVLKYFPWLFLAANKSWNQQMLETIKCGIGARFAPVLSRAFSRNVIRMRQVSVDEVAVSSKQLPTMETLVLMGEEVQASLRMKVIVVHA